MSYINCSASMLLASELSRSHYHCIKDLDELYLPSLYILLEFYYKIG